MSNLRDQLECDGRVWFRNALSEAELQYFDTHCSTGSAPGERLAWTAELDSIVGGGSMLSEMAHSLLPAADPVRLVAFNKSTDSNWLVPWHQDRVIAVREKMPVSGYVNWSNKTGTWHVEPPLSLLEKMIFARVHLDDTDKRNGCLELALGSHSLGHVNALEADEKARVLPHELCRARRGDVLFVKALCLHRSRPSKQATQRRTLRVDYSADAPAPPLQWAYI